MPVRNRFSIPRPCPSYPPELQQQIVELARTGLSPEELAREFDPKAWAIRNWIKEAHLDDGRHHDGPTPAERQELAPCDPTISSFALKEESWHTARQCTCSRTNMKTGAESGGRSHQRPYQQAGPGVGC